MHPAWVVVILGIIVIGALGVLGHAEQLARRLGDPYGTLVLTFSIVGIEVVLIAAVLFGPGDHTESARDSTLAATMLFLGLFLGIGILVATLRHPDRKFNRDGLSSYLSMLLPLGFLAFALPGLIGDDGAFHPAQAITVLILTLLSYGFFLWYQTTVGARNFREIDEGVNNSASARPVWISAVALVLTAIPIAVLSNDMAVLLDDGLGRLGAPSQLSGIIIAMVVLLPEALTMIRASWNGEIQRVSNLTHGAIVSVVGLTIPTVLTIGLITGQRIVFAESAINLALLGLLALVGLAMLGARRLTPIHGLAHVVVAVGYFLAVF